VNASEMGCECEGGGGCEREREGNGTLWALVQEGGGCERHGDGGVNRKVVAAGINGKEIGGCGR
jgi:hypothetical protein